jgi:hypothetical protein
MAQEEPESKQPPFHKHVVVSESEQTSPACVLTPALFSWRRKRNALLHERIAYLLFLLQEESKCLSGFVFLVVPSAEVSEPVWYRFNPAPQTSEKQANHHHLNQRLTGLHLPFVIFTGVFYCEKATRMFAPLPTCGAEWRSRVYPECVPLPPDPSLPQLDTTRLTLPLGRLRRPRFS